MKNGEEVAAFERAFAARVGAKYAIALCNGTATLHTALAALQINPWEPVSVPPLTMSATALAVRHANGVPEWTDVDPDTWLMNPPLPGLAIPVGLYGLNPRLDWPGVDIVLDAAQTLASHDSRHRFTSYSFQASKILSLGEGGMLVTDDAALAGRARAFSSLGYRLAPDQPRIDPATLKHPTYLRHERLGWNYRMNDLTADAGLRALDHVSTSLIQRATAAGYYADAVRGHSWLRPQVVPEGWAHDYWTYAVALARPDLWEPFVGLVERHGGERPYAAWALSYDEPVFALGSRSVSRETRCAVAESLQPRLVQFQTNRVGDAERNADAVRKAIRDLEARGLHEPPAHLT